MTSLIKTTTIAAGLSIAIIGISAVLPVQTRPEPASATQSQQECPPPTDKGAYHSRGYDKDGNISCGFTYYNECPYFAGAEAGTPECEKGKPTPEQMERWNPEEPSNTTTQPETVKPNECGGK